MPIYLYKILSMENWAASQVSERVHLSEEDKNFIHLCTEEQLERIIAKFWADSPEFVILKIAAEKLPGKMVLEANPGGTNKYYHLYHGYIPLNAIVEARKEKRFQ